MLLSEPYPALFSRVKLLLSEHSPVYEPLLQEAALQCLVILVHKCVRDRLQASTAAGADG